MFDVLDVAGELVDAAATSGTWRALLGLVASLPIALVAYLLVPERFGGTWIAGGIVLLGAVAGLVWEWNAVDSDNGKPPESPRDSEQ